MSVQIDVRNPQDLVATYQKILIQRNTVNLVAGMADVATIDIDQTNASDLSTGYTSYNDENGEVGVNYYRFRYKSTDGLVLSAWSDIFLAGGNTLFSRFRRMMRDTNSNSYFFEQEDLDFFLEQAIARLWPITWFETYSDSYFVPSGNTKIFNFPVGVTRVNGLEFLDQDSINMGRIINFQIRGKMILFDDSPPTSVIIRAWVEKMFTKLAEVPEIWDSHLLNIMRLQAFETFEADRSKYYKYNSVAKPEGGNLPSLDRIVTRIEAQISKRENQLRRTRKPASIKLI